MCRKDAKKEIDALKSNAIINIQQIVKILTTVIWKINRFECDYINQIAEGIVKIVRETVKNSSA